MSDSISISGQNRYVAIIEHIFFERYNEGDIEVPFERQDIVWTAQELGIEVPKNLGDVVYALRYRIDFPDSILDTQPEGMEWIIASAGRARYAFRLVKRNRIVPRDDLITIGIPDATPEIIASYAGSDEQGLLAIVRYNRLIDIFLGLTTYSLQNHWRTTLRSGSQIEIDEIYIGLDRHGAHYIIPVQAKGGSDQISVVQTQQDIQCCEEKFPGIAVRAISAQFMANDLIAMFLLTVEDDEVRVVEERHYRLIPANDLDDQAIRTYRP